MNTLKELRNTAERILFMERCIAEYGHTKQLRAGAHERLRDLKREYRRQLKEYCCEAENPAKWIYGDDEYSRHRYFEVAIDEDDIAEWQAYDKDLTLKQWLYERLWEEHASRVSNWAIDCTGEWFTSNYTVAHKYGGIYLVREDQGVDL